MERSTSSQPSPPVDERALENALGSPLRLRLMAELVAAREQSLTLDEAVRASGSHRLDVQACLRPMVAWGVVELLEPDQRWRLHPSMPAPLRRTLMRVLDSREEQVERMRRVRRHVLGGMIGTDPRMLMVFEMIHQVCRLDVPVLITGETGTGKELVARAIHELGPRRARHFGAVNCATLSNELFASEMFGHRKGAFTGAVRDHVGLFERAHRGTVLLDEVGDLSTANQVKLLRVLQEGTFLRVGDTEVRRSDFRLVSATNRDLAAMVAAGSFREDLFYRLNVFPLRVPSLRERIGDLPFIAEELLSGSLRRYHQGSGEPELTAGALQRLMQHSWPGNIRELENVLMRALVLAGGQAIGEAQLPVLESAPVPASEPVEDRLVRRSLAEVEREHVERVLRAHDGNISVCAAVLGVSRTTLYKKIRDHRIDLGDG